MDDQNEAWRRLMDARVKALEDAVQPSRIRRRRNGRPLPPLIYEPGDRRPLTKWLELRILAMELLFQLVLVADRARADELDVEDLEGPVTRDLQRMGAWLVKRLEPDIIARETLGMIEQAQIILMEAHTWPLMEMEELGL